MPSASQSIGFQATIPGQEPITSLPVKGNSYYQIMLMYVNSFFKPWLQFGKALQNQCDRGTDELAVPASRNTPRPQTARFGKTGYWLDCDHLVAYSTGTLLSRLIKSSRDGPLFRAATWSNRTHVNRFKANSECGRVRAQREVSVGRVNEQGVCY